MSTTNLALRYLADEATRPAWAADEGAWADRLRRWSVVGRIISLLHGMPDVALPHEPAPITQPADQPGRRGAQHQPGPPPPPRTRRRRRPRGSQRAEAQHARAMLTHLAHVAERAESDETADGAMAAMAGWLSRLTGALGGAGAQAPVRQAAPALRGALVDAGRALRGHARSRQYVSALPYALMRAARRIAAASAPGGRPPTVRGVARTIAGEVSRALGRGRTAQQLSRRAHARPCPHCGVRAGVAHAGCACGCDGTHAPIAATRRRRGTPPRGTPPRGIPPRGTPPRGTPPRGVPSGGAPSPAARRRGAAARGRTPRSMARIADRSRAALGRR